MMEQSGQIMGVEAGRGLKPKQEVALVALREGQRLADAAQNAGVDRATLYRWIQNDAHFKAAYNLWQQEVTESARSRLLKLAEKAVDVVEQQLEGGNERVALHLLRHLGVMRRRRQGSTDPEVLDLQITLGQKRDRYNAQRAMTNHLLTKAGFRPSERKRMMSGNTNSALKAELQNVLGPESPKPAAAPIATRVATSPATPPTANSTQGTSDEHFKSRMDQWINSFGDKADGPSADATRPTQGEGHVASNPVDPFDVNANSD